MIKNGMKQMTQMNKKVSIIGIIIFAGIFIYYFFENKNQNNNLKRNGIVTTGTVIKTASMKGGNTDFTFIYMVNGRTYTNSDLFGGLCFKLTGRIRKLKEFPVIYNEDDPAESRLLITKKSFDRVGQSQPDSLKWVETYCD
jgi:hypothetical protein